jgi:hypothetical protein
MARYYDVAAAAFALDVPPKWLDNLLSHHTVTGVEGGRQGVTRRITGDGLARLALIADLARGWGIPARVAIQMSDRLFDSPGCRLQLTPELRLDLDSDALARRLNESLVLSMEFAAAPRRGRPPAHVNRGAPTRRGGKENGAP